MNSAPFRKCPNYGWESVLNNPSISQLNTLQKSRFFSALNGFAPNEVSYHFPPLYLSDMQTKYMKAVTELMVIKWEILYARILSHMYSWEAINSPDSEGLPPAVGQTDDQVNWLDWGKSCLLRVSYKHGHMLPHLQLAVVPILCKYLYARVCVCLCEQYM